MTTDAPLVSVVIPCYNMGEYIKETIDSVKSQTFKDFEIIVVDDGSDDPATVACLDTLAVDQTVRLYRTSNHGLSAARNNGIAMARGRYILPLDGDDLIAPDFLDKTVAVLDRYPEIRVVATDAQLFGAVNRVKRLPEFSVKRLLSENLLFATSLFRKSDWQAVGGYCTAMRFGWEDWEFWLAICKQDRHVVRLTEPIFLYRIRENSMNRSMTYLKKATMLLVIVVRHWESYLKYPGSLVTLITNAKAFCNGMSS